MAKMQHIDQVDGLAQDCSNSIANALELLQSYTKPSRWSMECFSHMLWRKIMMLQRGSTAKLIFVNIKHLYHFWQIKPNTNSFMKKIHFQNLVNDQQHLLMRLNKSVLNLRIALIIILIQNIHIKQISKVYNFINRSLINLVLFRLEFIINNINNQLVWGTYLQRDLLLVVQTFT